MNSFGKNFRLHIFGESHGDFVGICIDGCPPGISLNTNDFIMDLERRRGGLHPATTSRQEEDIPEIISGIFNGYTTGSPLTIICKNANTQSKDYEDFKKIPRPGHADWVAQQKYKGFQDYRGGGHFSGRLTLPIVAAGVVAKKICSALHFQANLIEVYGESDVEKGLKVALENKDSVGGIVECMVEGIPVGLGEPFFDSVESVISHLAFSIPAIKGIEFGNGFAATRLFGSQNNDAIENETGKTKTNNAGGISGGISNGNSLVFRVAIKPSSSTPKEQVSFNVETNSVETFAVKGRHDLCIALRVPVIMEAVAAIVFADFLQPGGK